MVFPCNASIKIYGSSVLHFIYDNPCVRNIIFEIHQRFCLFYRSFPSGATCSSPCKESRRSRTTWNSSGSRTTRSTSWNRCAISVNSRVTATNTPRVAKRNPWHPSLDFSSVHVPQFGARMAWVWAHERAPLPRGSRLHRKSARGGDDRQREVHRWGHKKVLRPPTLRFFFQPAN